MAVGQIISRAIAQGAVTADDIGALEITHAKLHTDMDLSSKTVTMPAVIRGPATLTIDPAAVGDNTGTLVIAGNLQVDGTTTTINSTTMTVDDKNLVLASGAGNSSAADGAGITIDGASATMLYTHATTSFDFNKQVNVTGNLTLTSTADVGPVINLISNDHSDAADFNTEGSIKFFNDNDADESTLYAQIRSITADVTDGSEDGWMYFSSIRDGTMKNTFAAAGPDLLMLDDASVIQFRSWGGTANHVTITPSTPSANRTITLPNATGTVVLADSSSRIGVNQTPASNNYTLQVTGLATNGTDGRAVLVKGNSASTTIGGAGPSIAIQNTNSTANNVTKLSFETQGAGEAVSINAINTNHSSFYGDLAINTRGAGGYSEKMRVMADGNVGIGTTNPGTLLDVRGEVSIAYNANYGLRFYNQGRSNWGSIGNMDTGTGADLTFKSGSGTITFTHSGDLQLGDIQETTGGGNISLTKTSSSSIVSIMSRSATDGHTGMLNFFKTPATSGNYTPTTSGDVLGEIRFYGVNNSSVADIGAMIQVSQTGAFNNSVPGKMTFTTQETQRISIHADGHIGIGDNVTVSSAWSTVFGARVQLDTKGVLAATDGSMQIGHNWYYDGGGTTGYKYIASGKANRQIHVDDYISWEMEETAGTAGNEITFTERMRLTKDGNLGLNVGSNNPSDRLVVVAGGTGILVARNWSGNVTTGQGLGEIGFKGYASGNSTLGADAKIGGVADGNHSGTSAPARLEFYVKHPTTGPGSAPTKRMQLSSYGELLLEAGARGWSSFYMNSNAGIRYHVKRFYANASVVTNSFLRVKRHYWGVGFYKIWLKQQYYYSTPEAWWNLSGYGRADGSYNPNYALNYNDEYGGMGSSRLQLTTPSTSAPGSTAAAYVDVQIVVPAYHHYILVIEAGGMASYSHDPSSMSGNDMYALH